jgi:hypothetical protein
MNLLAKLVIAVLFFAGLWLAFNASYDVLKLLFLICYVVAWSGAVALRRAM